MKIKKLDALLSLSRSIKLASGRYDRIYQPSVMEIIELSKIELSIMARGFNINEKEALFLSASCIYVLEEWDTSEFRVGDLCSTLGIDNIEILLYLKYFRMLVEKGFWIEIPKENLPSPYDFKSAFEVLNYEFVLNTSLGEHLV